MRVLIVNTSDMVGGAAVAANRLMVALNNNGVKTKMLVRDKVGNDLSVLTLRHRLLAQWHFLYERLCIFLSLRFHTKHLWEIDRAIAGNDITSLPEFQKADVIHLSWINQGMLSMDSIRKILHSGKAVVWTMHDLWPATGICHYARGCENYVDGCHHCPLLPSGGGEKDLSSRVWKKKQRVYGEGNIHFVTCSKWLELSARKSSLLRGFSISSIPNPIDTSVFAPKDKPQMREKYGLPSGKQVILFVAQKVTDERKGAPYLVKALQHICDNDASFAENVCIALLGGHTEELAQQLPLSAFPLGYIHGDHNLAEVYNLADVFVLPSMEDNLPNTIMEALACGVPCVGFNVGGIPEMIDHRVNGYVAREGSVEDLAEGLRWTLAHADSDSLSAKALSKAHRAYSQQSVAMRYLEVYSQALAHKRYRL